MSKGARHYDEQRYSSFIHHALAFNHDMAPSPLSPFAKNQRALGVRRRDLPLIGPTTWQTSLCLQQYIFTLRRRDTATHVSHTHVHTGTYTHFQTHALNTKNECFRCWERREAGDSPSEWQTALSERALVVVTSIRTLEQTKAGLGVSSINGLTVDFSLFVPHSA